MSNKSLSKLELRKLQKFIESEARRSFNSDSQGLDNGFRTPRELIGIADPYLQTGLLMKRSVLNLVNVMIKVGALSDAGGQRVKARIHYLWRRERRKYLARKDVEKAPE